MTIPIRKIILLLLFFCAVFTLSAQLREDSYQGFKLEKNGDINIISIKIVPVGGGIKQFYDAATNKPLDGTYHFIIHRRRYMVGNLKKGLPQDDWTEYINMAIHEKTPYKDGKPDGIACRYNSMGELSSQTIMKEGVRQEYITYLDNGEINEKITYDENGRKHGHFIIRNFSGKIIGEETYEHGERVGKYIEYQDHGKIVSHYKNGKLCGEYTYYYLNGNIKNQGHYDENSKQHGKWIRNRENGDPYKEENFLHGQLHGEQRDYFEGGRLRNLSEYSNGKLNGKNIFYRDDPYCISSESTYVNGIQHGECKNYYNGKLSRIQIYRDNRIICEKIYNDGKLSALLLVDEKGSMVRVAEYNKAGQRTYKNATYKKPVDIKLKEDVSGVIDVDFD